MFFYRKLLHQIKMYSTFAVLNNLKKTYDASSTVAISPQSSPLKRLVATTPGHSPLNPFGCQGSSASSSLPV